MTTDTTTPSAVFQLLPGEQVLWIVGMPGPDVDKCEVVSQDGDAVTIRFQVWGQGPFHEKVVSLERDITWRKDSDTECRHRQWKAIQ
jgi:hypothetical protein